jgi:hypothetical protein
MDRTEGQCFADAVEKIRTRYIHAEILGQDNRPLATGAASPKADGTSPIFHLDLPIRVGNLATKAAFLRRADGSTEKILRCTRCPTSKNAMHLHLETQV